MLARPASGGVGLRRQHGRLSCLNVGLGRTHPVLEGLRVDLGDQLTRLDLAN
jgi:hypothetical protein